MFYNDALFFFGCFVRERKRVICFVKYCFLFVSSFVIKLVVAVVRFACWQKALTRREGGAIWYKEAKRLGDRSQASERGAKVGRDLGIIYFNYQFSRAAPISSTRPCLPVSFTDCRQDACQKTEWPP